MADVIASSFWLTISSERRGSSLKLNTPRCTKTKPSVNANEITMEVTLKLPRLLFDRPALTAEIAIDPENVGSPEIEADVVNQIEEIARTQGIEITLHQEAADAG